MKIAIGLPVAVPDTPGRLLVDWAIEAEQHGFSSLGTISRIVFDSHEELISLAAAAAVTTEIGLATTVLIGPARSSVLLAKQAATLDNISGGRLSLGLGVGWREDDYTATGASFHERGHLLEEQAQTLRRVWAGEPPGDDLDVVGPRTGSDTGPELMMGGMVPPALERVGRLADAFVATPVPAEMTAGLYGTVSAAAEAAGRPAPRLVAARYVALSVSDELAQASLRSYYAFAGPDMVEMTVSSMLRTPEDVWRDIDALAAVGVDELFLWPSVADLAQVELIRAASTG